jgi:hypothetical protein
VLNLWWWWWCQGDICHHSVTITSHLQVGGDAESEHYLA